LAVTDWRLRRWRLWFLALSNAPRNGASSNESGRRVGKKITLSKIFFSMTKWMVCVGVPEKVNLISNHLVYSDFASRCLQNQVFGWLS